MKEAADRAILFALENNPDGITEVSPTGDIIGHIAVSVDGSGKRGHCSKTGVVFVMSVDTGEVIDYELKTIFCRVCLINVTFVGDGDSASFGTVKEACLNVYGNEYVVQKEECVGHIQKRMGTALRELKRKSKGILLADKTIGGKGRLTDVYIDSIQNYYGQAISNNNDIVSMQNAIWAIFYHDTSGRSHTITGTTSILPRRLLV